MSLQGLFYGYAAQPTAAKGTLPPEGQLAFYIDSTTNHFSMIDSNGTVTDLTDQSFSADFSFAEGVDMTFGTSNGTMIGTASQQKLSFFGVTPVVKGTALTAANATALDATYDSSEQTTVSNMRVRINEIESRLQDIGIIN
jgi:hypothetical protein